MADNTSKRVARSSTATFDRWTAEPRKPSAAALSEQQRDLWTALNEYIRANGGWVVSVPGLTTLRVEIPQSSPLPMKLAGLGYRVRHAGTATRLVPGGMVETITQHSTGQPFTRRHDGIVPVDVLDLRRAI
jgi:hypothetical protein